MILSFFHTIMTIVLCYVYAEISSKLLCFSPTNVAMIMIMNMTDFYFMAADSVVDGHYVLLMFTFLSEARCRRRCTLPASYLYRLVKRQCQQTARKHFM